jgi:predicted GNAT family acetyltransferase
LRLGAFVEFHRPALEASEVRHNLILGLLAERSAWRLRRWSFDAPGACAIQRPGSPIALGALSEADCHRLADETREVQFPGVVGTDETARWFVDRAVEVGLSFREAIPQQIHALQATPTYPGAPGHARQVGAEDAALFADWMLAFHDEALAHDRKPTRRQLVKLAGEALQLIWVVNGDPVSTAGIARRTRNTAAISRVYTPPALRGRGYAGSVTAAVVARIFAEGKTAACLYTDLRNPFSNRCYARIGFKSVCPAWHFVRRSQAHEPPTEAATQ